MDEIRQYLISVTATAIFCGVITGLAGKKGGASAVIRLLSGLFLAYTVIAPWTRIKISDISHYTSDIAASAQRYVQSGTDYANLQTAAIIKERSEAYILDKAVSMGANIQVDITLTDTVPSVPESAVITGAVSPYAKERLQVCFFSDLGIPKENLIWN